MTERICGPCSRGQHAPCDGQNEFWGDCTCWCNINDQGHDPAYCESCEADRLWEEEGIQPVWASPTHTCGCDASAEAGGEGR